MTDSKKGFVTVSDMARVFANLQARGYGHLPVRFVQGIKDGMVWTKPMLAVQVFADEEIGPFIAFTCDELSRAILKANAKKLIDPMEHPSEIKDIL